MRSKQLWKKNKRDKAASILKDIIKMYKKQGWRWCLQDKLLFRSFLALSNNVVYLGSNYTLQTNQARAIIQDMEKAGETALEDFEKHAYLQRTKVLQNNTEWEFVTPLYLDFWGDVRLPIQITILGTTYILKKWGKEKSVLNNSNLFANAKLYGFNNKNWHDGLCLKFKAKGTSCPNAWMNNSKSIDLFRGMLEFRISKGKYNWKIQLGNKSSIPHPLWAVGVPKQGKANSIFFSQISPDTSKPIKINLSTWKQIQSFSRIFNQKSGQQHTITSMIADCLRLYVQAFDAIYEYERLLSLWQLAERITLSSEIKTITKRLLFFTTLWNTDFPAKEEALSKIADMRNCIVHQGTHFIADIEDVFFLQLLCEEAIKWLILEKDKINNEELLEWFYKTLNMKDQKQVKKTLLKLSHLI